jgi:hypothetical protein
MSETPAIDEDFNDVIEDYLQVIGVEETLVVLFSALCALDGHSEVLH